MDSSLRKCCVSASLRCKPSATSSALMTESGAAIFFSTHVLEVAEKLCNKIAIIKEGRLVASGDTESVIGGDSSLEELFLELNADE